MRERKKGRPELSRWCPYPGKRECLFHLGWAAGFEVPDGLVVELYDQLLHLPPELAAQAEDVKCRNKKTGQIVIVKRFEHPAFKQASFN